MHISSITTHCLLPFKKMISVTWNCIHTTQNNFPAIQTFTKPIVCQAILGAVSCHKLQHPKRRKQTWPRRYYEVYPKTQIMPTMSLMVGKTGRLWRRPRLLESSANTQWRWARQPTLLASLEPVNQLANQRRECTAIAQLVIHIHDLVWYSDLK